MKMSCLWRECVRLTKRLSNLLELINDIIASALFPSLLKTINQQIANQTAVSPSNLRSGPAGVR